MMKLRKALSVFLFPYTQACTNSPDFTPTTQDTQHVYQDDFVVQSKPLTTVPGGAFHLNLGGCTKLHEVSGSLGGHWEDREGSSEITSLFLLPTPSINFNPT